MPEIVKNGVNDERRVNELNDIGKTSSLNEISSPTKTLKNSLSSQRRQSVGPNFPIHRVIDGVSDERRVNELNGTGNTSPLKETSSPTKTLKSSLSSQRRQSVGPNFPIHRVIDGVSDERRVNELNGIGNTSPLKETSSPTKIPKSYLSSQRRQSIGPNFPIHRVIDGVNDEIRVNELNGIGNTSSLKETSSPTKIPRSSLSSQRRQSVGPNFSIHRVIDEVNGEIRVNELNGIETTSPLKETPSPTKIPRCSLSSQRRQSVGSNFPVHRVIDGVNDERRVNELNGIGNTSPLKETSSPTKIPRSSLSLQRRQSVGPNFPIHRVIGTSSIDQHHENVYDKQSFSQSSSGKSFEFDGDEFQTDSELHHLVKEELKKKTQWDSGSDPSSKMGSLSNDKKLDMIRPATASCVVSQIPKKALQSELALETPSSSPKGKGPLQKPAADRKNDNPLKKQSTGVTRVKKTVGGRSLSQTHIDNFTGSALDRPELGMALLNQARSLISSGDNPLKALELALQAKKLFERAAAHGKPSLDLAMCLHVTAAIYCSLGHFHEAIPIVERSIEIPVVEKGQQHATAKFAGHMHLGDIYAMLGQLEKSIKCYTEGLNVQRKVLGETDPRVGETCRYVAEANFQALQFDEAERLCKIALDIHKANGSPSSLEEAADRRLMGLICEANGKHESALEHLVLASMAMVANGQDVEVASVDCSIGDTFLSLARYDEAVFAYQKALTVYKTHIGENHPAVGSVFVRLAELHCRTWKIKESKSYCENALRIYENPMPGVPSEEIASGFMNVSAIYESMDELKPALDLLHKALKILNEASGQQNTIAGIEAQMGVMYYMLENYTESYNAFKNAVSKLRDTGEKKSAFFGTVLNQMGLACAHLHALSEAAELFEEAKAILEQENGPYHPETLGVYGNLAGTYDAIGRVDEAIQILENILVIREEKLGTANPDVADEKRRLELLLKETGRVRKRKTKSLEILFDDILFDDED